MPRVARIVIPGIPHHITQRGNMRADVFFEEEDYALYTKLLINYSRKYSLDVWAYCFMTNHIHLVAVPEFETSMAYALRDTHQTYALAVNRRFERTGHLWQGRYYSCALDDQHLWTAVRYVENNPVRAGIVERAEDFNYSSAKAHCGLRKDPILSRGGLETNKITDNWSEWLGQGNDSQLENKLLENTGTGRPYGSESFIENIERLLDRPIKKRSPGRKRTE